MVGCSSLFKRLPCSLKRKPSMASSMTTSTVIGSDHKLDHSTHTPKEALDFIHFLNASPSPFHAVHEASVRLENAGFEKINEKQQWHLKKKGKYYFTRNGSSIVAFIVGGQFQVGQGGFSIVGAHTDSPCLKVKPVSKKEQQGYLEVGVQLYGGGIWHTWFDRDLGIAGRVMVEKHDGTFHHSLVHIKK